MRESYLERRLCDGVRAKSGWAVKLVGTAGMPDRLVLLPGGRARLVEMKAPDGRLSPLQVSTHKRLMKLGFPVFVLWSSDDVRRFLDDLPEVR